MGYDAAEKIIILDEATSQMDGAAQEAMAELLRRSGPGEGYGLLSNNLQIQSYARSSWAFIRSICPANRRRFSALASWRV